MPETVYSTDEVDSAIAAAVAAPVTADHISDFLEAVQDAVAAMLAAGSSIALSYDDTAGALTITDTGDGSGGGALDVEGVRDAIGVALVGVGLITVTANDAADTITISTAATTNSPDTVLLDRANHTGTQPVSTVTGISAAALTLLDDASVSAMRATLGAPSITGATDIAVVAARPATPDPNTVYVVKSGVVAIPPSATPTINCDTTEVAVISPLSTAITGITISGIPRPDQPLRIKLKDNGTSRTIAHGPGKKSSGVAPLLTATKPNMWHRELLVHDNDIAAWVCMASDPVGY